MPELEELEKKRQRQMRRQFAEAARLERHAEIEREMEDLGPRRARKRVCYNTDAYDDMIDSYLEDEGYSRRRNRKTVNNAEMDNQYEYEETAAEVAP